MTSDGAGLGESVETEVWELFDADTSISDATMYLVAAALSSAEDLEQHLGAEIATPRRPEPQSADEPPPLRAFLHSVSVTGFRGIGTSATLQVNPYCGITVISGRNGSGKSSFAEALEFALTGQSYRWVKKKGQHWRASWRNLHAGEPVQIRVDFAMETDSGHGGTVTTMGVDWQPGADLGDAERWSQIRGQKKQPVDAVGWNQALITHRPLMSYDEIGGLLEDGPFSLFDAYNRLLGLDEITDADARLKDAEKRLGGPRKAANATRTSTMQLLEKSADPRAAQVQRLLTRHRPYDLAAITAITLGTDTDRASTLAQLRAIATNEPIDVANADDVARELEEAVGAHADAAGSAVTAMAARAELLREALHLHTDTGDGPCPVCETGFLDAGWRAAAEERLHAADASTAEHRAVTGRLSRARAAAEGFFAAKTVPAVDDVELATLPSFTEALTNARTTPTVLVDLPGHLRTSAHHLAEAAAALQAEATQRANELDDAWAPVARAVSAWVQMEEDARTGDARLDEVTTALAWLRRNAETLRQRRLAPVITQASHIWDQMRHESNVDLTGISLEGAGNKRKAVVEGTVDGTPTGALSVMSQGELHALALALFIPRATTPASPFRFLVLDDPIQAMDPAKISGFLNVLVELAKTRQVIVFSHDDRLPAAIRNRSVPAQLLDVTREAESVVTVKANDLPAHRYIDDATAVVLDSGLDDVIKSKAAPGLFRMAVEAAAQHKFFTDRAQIGAHHDESETTWSAANTTQKRVALAINTDVAAWKSQRSHRNSTMRICTHGVHHGAPLDIVALNDLRRTVHDIVGTP